MQLFPAHSVSTAFVPKLAFSLELIIGNRDTIG